MALWIRPVNEDQFTTGQHVSDIPLLFISQVTYKNADDKEDYGYMEDDRVENVPSPFICAKKVRFRDTHIFSTFIAHSLFLKKRFCDRTF